MNDIVIEHLCKRYGEKTVLKDFCAEIPAGKITCIMGESGCGKTTLLNILMGFEKADSGNIRDLPAGLSAVFQENRLCEEFSAVANLRLVMGNRCPADEIRKHLSLLRLPDTIREPVGKFSGGMKRRVAIARAVLYPADLLLMDEPFKGLDDSTKDAVMDYVLEYTAGKTVILVTHEPEESEKMGGKRIYMENVR